MGRQNVIIKEEKPPHPLIPVFGFIVFMIVGGLAFWVSPRVVHWLATANFSLVGGLLQVLPIDFPPKWPMIVKQLIVTVAMFLVFFAIAMSALFFIMKPPGADTDVSLAQIRKEKKKMTRH